jgi:hypothetical protein
MKSNSETALFILIATNYAGISSIVCLRIIETHTPREFH